VWVRLCVHACLRVALRVRESVCALVPMWVSHTDWHRNAHRHTHTFRHKIIAHTKGHTNAHKDTHVVCIACVSWCVYTGKLSPSLPPWFSTLFIYMIIQSLCCVFCFLGRVLLRNWNFSKLFSFSWGTIKNQQKTSPRLRNWIWIRSGIFVSRLCSHLVVMNKWFSFRLICAQHFPVLWFHFSYVINWIFLIIFHCWWAI
jgi:hypothetical protein